MSKTAINRQQGGLAIVQLEGAIKRINASLSNIKSQNGNGDYDVCSTELGWFARVLTINFAV
ncbi:MAG: hypothetical protein WAZ77_11540 [Candidatus Nitrosopolaris sp.]|jgi:hypothetical protein